MAKLFKYHNALVKVYHGYGHTHNLVVYGHVFKSRAVIRTLYTGNIFTNIFHLFRLFFVKPLSHAKVQLHWGSQVICSITAEDGFFKFEWKSDTDVAAGWHDIVVNLRDESGDIAATGKGKIFVPHSTQFAFVSDIDDTVLISHSAAIGKRLGLLFTKNPRTRKAFTDVVKHYRLLALAHTGVQVPNPFFYVSGSEWNLYDDLNDFFKHNGLPKGVFLLNPLKSWYQLFKTGKTQHEAKLLRIARILEAFPKQQFILLGDNSQSDPSIYASIADKYGARIFAVYIRNIVSKNERDVKQVMADIEKKGIFTCFFKDNTEAIKHSKMIGLTE